MSDNQRSRGLPTKVLSGTSKILGVGKAYRGAKAGVRFITFPLRSIRDSVANLKYKSNGCDFSAYEDDADRFAAAAKHFARTEKDVDDMANAHKRLSLTFFVLALALIGWGFFYTTRLGLGFPVMDAIFGFGIVILPLMMLFKHAFFYVQLRDRRLYRVSYFIRNLGLVFSKTSAALLAVLIATYVIGSPSSSIADVYSLEPISPVVNGAYSRENDIFYQLMQMLLPNVAGIDQSTNPSPWVEPVKLAFGTFNILLLSVAVMMMSYMTVTTVIISSQEGVPLGSKVNNVFAPLRVCFGLGMLAPVAGGLGGVQILVITVALLGSDMASKVWLGFTDYYSSEYARATAKSIEQGAPDAQNMTLEEKMATLQKAVMDTPIANVTAGLPKDFDMGSNYSAKSMLQNEQIRTMALGIVEKQACLGTIREAYRYAFTSFVYNSREYPKEFWNKRGAADQNEAFLTLVENKGAIGKENRQIWDTVTQTATVTANTNWLGIPKKSKDGKKVLESLSREDLINGYVTPKMVNIEDHRMGGVSDRSIYFHDNDRFTLEEAPFFRWTSKGYGTIPTIRMDYGTICGSVDVTSVNPELTSQLKKTYMSLNRIGEVRSAIGTFTNEAATKMEIDILNIQGNAVKELRGKLENLIIKDFSRVSEAIIAATTPKDAFRNYHDDWNDRRKIMKSLYGVDEDADGTTGNGGFDINRATATLQNVLSKTGLTADQINQQLAAKMKENGLTSEAAINELLAANNLPDVNTLYDGAMDAIKSTKSASDLLADAVAQFQKEALLSGLKTELAVNEMLKKNNMNGLDSIVKIMGTQGWASAGSFYNVLAQINSQRFLMMNVEASQTATSYETLQVAKEKSPHIWRYAFGDETYAGSIPTTQGFLETYVDENTALENLTELDGSSDGLFEWMNSKIGSLLSTKIEEYEKKTIRPHTAFIDLVSWGFSVLDALMLLLVGAMTIIAAKTTLVGKAASIAANTVTPNFSGVGLGMVGKTVVGTVVFAARMAIILVFVVGVLFAYILPIIPYFYHLFAVIGMLILILEALIATPLWMFNHVNLKGDDFVTDNVKQGYMIMFNVLIRPSLITLALILSFGLFSVGVWLVQKTVFTAYFSTIGAGQGVVGSLLFFAVIGYLHWQMALQAFSLITELPDRVMRWIGMQPEGLGERGETERATGFFVAGVNNRVESFGNAGLMKNALSGSGVPKGSDKGSSGKMGGIPKPK